MSSDNRQSDDIDVQGTMNTWVIAAISPILIMILVGSLTYFLIDVFYQGGFNERVKYILTLFIMAVVLIARISIDEGRSYASMYAIPLALATWFVTGRFVVFEGGILGAFNFLILPFLLGLIWWCADRLTWDCTVVDFSRDVSNQGLLQSVAERMRDVKRTGEVLADAQGRRRETVSTTDDETSEAASQTGDAISSPLAKSTSNKSTTSSVSAWRDGPPDDRSRHNSVSAATFGLDESGNIVDPTRINLDEPVLGTTSRSIQQKPPWWKSLPIFQRKQNTPGVWVFYFSLAAIPIFGFGQAFVPASDVASRRWLFFYFVLYTMAGLGLLLTTSLLSLQRYLRQRDVEMPNPIAVTWVVAGGIGILGILAVVWLLPRPAPEYAWLPNPVKIVASKKLRSNRFGTGNEGVQDEKQNSATTSGATEQGGQTPSSRGGSPSKGSSSKQSQPQSGDEQSKSSQNPSGQQSDSQQSSGEGGKSGGQESSSSSSSAKQSSAGNDRSEQNKNANQESNSGSADSNRSSADEESDGQKGSSQTGQTDQKSNQQQSSSSQTDDDRQSSSNPDKQSRANESEKTNGDNRQNGSASQSSSTGSSQRQERSETSQASAESNRQSSSQTGNGSEQANRSRSSNSNPLNQSMAWLNTIANNLKWILAAIVLAVIMVLAWKYRDQLADSWRQFCQQWREFWERLFGRRKESVEVEVKVQEQDKKPLPNFTAYKDPFESGEWQRWSPTQLLAYTFDAFEAWGRDRACPREVDLTPSEYARQVSRHDREVGRAASKLADLYAEVAYSQTPPTRHATESIRGFWQVMRNRYQPARNAASLQRESL